MSTANREERRAERSDGSGWLNRALGARWPRTVTDIVVCVGFAATLTLLLVGGHGVGGSAAPVALELVVGGQRQGIYRDGQRVGTVRHRVQREDKGWRVWHEIRIGEERATEIVLRLRRDLSLSGFELSADVRQLSSISGLPAVLRAGMRQLKTIKMRGRCELESGDCQLRGRVGGHEVHQRVPAGRGPVVTSAIYPLLAQGSLGREAELRIFDPLTLGQRVVTFTVEGREALELHSGRFQAIRVKRDVESLGTRIWIDDKGRVLKEDLPLGLTVEHEAWEKP